MSRPPARKQQPPPQSCATVRGVSRLPAQSASAAAALSLVRRLQVRLAERLGEVSTARGTPATFESISWLRDGGVHGGGDRRAIGDTAVFDRASINVSEVHYDDQPERKLGSATALSTIIHPANPHASSMHMHISWTQMKTGPGGWRIMADLNPAIPQSAPAAAFERCLRTAAPDHFEVARAQGDRYFFIPSLDRHRGVVHFYLEGHRSADPGADVALARRVGEAVIETYCATLQACLAAHPEPTPDDRAAQLAYHTLYFLQVLTLDRGTTSGLLVHDQNDVGILGSLPSHVDRDLLHSWIARQPVPQGSLLEGLIAALPAGSPSPITESVKRALAATVRAHYRRHPEALALQASGDAPTTTVDNHR